MPSKPTDIELRNAKPRATVYRIAFGEGFCLEVWPTGAKYWRLRYKFAGREKMIGFGVYAPGTFKHVSAKDAMQKAADARALLARGVDPSEARREEKHALRLSVARTFGDAANKWADHNAPRWRPATREKVDQYLRKDLLPTLGKRPLANINALELGEIVGKIEERKALNVAKKTRQWLSRIFEFAIAKGLTATNPAEYLGAVAAPEPPVENHAHLALADLPAFLRALDAYAGSEITKGATWLALWTANRPGVTRTLRWSEVDLDGALWTIPKGRDGMKRGYSHLTPLPRQAVALLRKIHAITGTFEYVFVGRNDPRQPMSDGAITGMLKTMGYGGRQTAHGFRHLVSTALNERGYKADWIERQLAHGDPDAIRDTYNKAHYLADRKKMMQAWADYLDEIKEGGAVLPFRKRSGASRQ